MRRLILIILAMLLMAPMANAAEQKYVKKILDNGLTVVVKPEKGSGLVAIVALVKVGAAQESIQTAGIGNFITQLLLASTRAKSAEKVASIASEVGGSINAQWHQDCTEIRIVTTSGGFDQAIRLVGECLSEANFESKWVEQARADLISKMNSNNDDLFNGAYDTLRELLFEDSGYRRAMLGTQRVIQSATPADLQKFYSSYFVPNNTVISIAGDVTAEAAFTMAAKAYAGVSPKKLPINRGMPDEKLDIVRSRVREADIEVAYLMLGWHAPALGSPDYPAFSVLANALGGGKGSRLFQEVRQKQGMGYEVGIHYPALKYQSMLLSYIVTDPYRMTMESTHGTLILNDVKSAMLKQVQELKECTLSDRDLDRAKGYTIGTFSLQHQHLIDRAYLLGWLETIGLGAEFDSAFADSVDKVTASDVQRVARKYLGNYAAVVLLPKSKQLLPGDGTMIE